MISADSEPFKFVALLFSDPESSDSGTYTCSISYTNPQTAAVQSHSVSVVMNVESCDPGYFPCYDTLADVPSPSQAFSTSIVDSPSPVDYPGAGMVCLNNSKRCDGHFDCPSRSDELRCGRMYSIHRCRAHVNNLAKFISGRVSANTHNHMTSTHTFYK